MGTSILTDVATLDVNSFVDSLETGIIVIDERGNITTWNTWMSTHSFIDRETAIGKSLCAVFPNLDNPLTELIDAATVRGFAELPPHGDQCSPLPLYENRDAREADQRIEHSIQVKPCQINNEWFAVVQIKDFDYSASHEQTLLQQSHEIETISAVAREKERQLKTILDSSKDSVIILNRLGRISGFYLSAQKMFGYQEIEILGKPLASLLPPPHSQKIEYLFTQGDASHELDIHMEASALRSDGELFYTDMSIRTIHEGSEFHHVVTISDITDRKQVQDALYQEKEQAQVTLSSIADGVLTTDIIGRVNFINPAALKLIGQSRDKVINNRIDRVVNIESERSQLPVFECIESGVQIDSISGDVLYNHDGESLIIHQVASPIHNQMGDTIGAVMIFRDVSKSHRLASRLSWQASHDDLTRLINRRELERHLQQAMESAINENVEHCLCYMDLDKFKVVNDTCGHAAGDELLKQLADIFRSNVRGADILARLGGDEFAIILTQCSLEPGLHVAEKIRLAIENFRFAWADTSFQIGVSIGLVVIDAECPDLNEIFRAADSACYAAKEAGRNRIQVYNPDNVEIAHRQGQTQWMLRIQQALENDRFELHYQTIVPVSNRENGTVHYEILVRMIDENGELIPPGAFIPSAERYHLMTKIDFWVIYNLFQWLEQYWDTSSDGIFAINLSGQSMADDQLLKKIKQLIEASSIEPQNISFEITETAAISNLVLAKEFISDLKKIGCKFALDDFGSGLSSFAYLKNLPVDYLKIDGAFVKDMVRDPIDRAMVESIHHIGSVMNLKTIAEFVENDEILKVLQEVGVDYAQGYGIARPKPLPRNKTNLSKLE